MRAPWPVVALILLACVPQVGAQRPVEQCSEQCTATDEDVNAEVPVRGGTANVVLYAHFEDILNMAPLNTVPPDPDHEHDLNRGFFPTPTIDTDTGACTGQTCADFHFKNNEFRMFFCPGTIDMDRSGGWYYNCHAPGLAEPLDVTGPMTLYFYVGAGNINPSLGETGASAMPNIRVAARVEADFREPLVLARGASQPTAITTVSQEPVVYEFKVELEPLPLSPENVAQRMRSGLYIVVGVEQISSGETVEVAQPGWSVRTGPQFPPRIIIPTKDPIRLERVLATVQDGDVYGRAIVRAVYGAYDLDADSLRARIVAPGTDKDVDPRALELIEVRRAISDHDGVLKPANITWKVHPEHLDLGGSVYRIDFEVRNLQGTYELAESIPIPMTAFEGKAVPNVSAFLALAVFGIGVLLRGPRRSP